MKYEKLVRNIEITLGVILLLLVIAYFAVPFILSIIEAEFTVEGILAIIIVIVIILLLLAFTADELLSMRKKK